MFRRVLRLWPLLFLLPVDRAARRDPVLSRSDERGETYGLCSRDDGRDDCDGSRRDYWTSAKPWRSFDDEPC